MKEKFVPYNKLSKKEKRQLAAIKRGDFGAISPVTRVAENKKGYNRKRMAHADCDYDSDYDCD